MNDDRAGLSASERAYRSIRDDIIEGVLATGTMIGEASVAAELGISRTPVRVALARLQDEGWITIYPKRGALVQGLSERTIAELADARLTLEATSVSRASDALRAQLAERLDASLDAQRAAFAADDVRGFIDLTLAFHRGFVEASGSAVLLELHDRLSDRHRYVLFASGDRMLARCTEIITEHVALVAHLRAGDAAAFAEELRGHISETGAVVVPALAVHGIDTAASA